MYISSFMKRDILKLVQQKPLTEGEYRLIPKMGSHYISISSKWGEGTFLCEIEMEDGSKLYLYKKLS